MATVKFNPPKDFRIPEHEGTKFDLVCTFEIEGEELCLTMLGNTPMPGYEKGKKDEREEKTESKPSYDSYAKEMVEAGPTDMG